MVTAAGQSSALPMRLAGSFSFSLGAPRPAWVTLAVAGCPRGPVGPLGGHCPFLLEGHTQ